MVTRFQSRTFCSFLLSALFVICVLVVSCSNNSSTTSSSAASDPATSPQNTGGQTADPTSPTADTFEIFTPPAFTNLVSPVTSTTLTLSSPFGPRLQASESYRYDFHRGIDIPGTLGDPIYAIASGTIYSVYEEGSTSYPDGGNVVIIKHTLSTPFTFHGQTVDKIYSESMHLNSFGSAAQAYLDSGEQRAVTQGMQIGTMGSSGITDFVHLHLETRLGTTCSLEYQLENPTLDCADFGFDPHINPMTFFVDGLNANDFLILFTSVASTEATIEIRAQPDALIVDGVTFEVFATDDGIQAMGDPLYSATASFDQRESFDATSTASLDTANIDGFDVSPAAFNSSSTENVITFNADIPTSVWTGRTEVLVKATLRTTLGEVASVQQSLTR